MDDREQVKQCYEKMCSAMIKKDREALEIVLDDSYVLFHMTGMRQSKSEFTIPLFMRVNPWRSQAIKPLRWDVPTFRRRYSAAENTTGTYSKHAA